MARSININTVKLYRALVEVKRDDEWEPWTVFGPYSSRGACIDRDARWYREAYEVGRRRVRKQVLVPILVDGELGLEWVDC